MSTIGRGFGIGAFMEVGDGPAREAAGAFPEVILAGKEIRRDQARRSTGQTVLVDVERRAFHGHVKPG
jgi:hypothetical protein